MTFADLMGLMMSFFVMLVAFSTQDTAKLKIVAGSMRDAFGVQSEARFPASSNPTACRRGGKLQATPPTSCPRRPRTRRAPTRTAATSLPARELKIDREFALASASLRQALQDMPEITEISKNIMFEETKEGLNLEIVDQDGRSMFADGSKVPYERTRLLLQKLAAPLKATPLRVAIVGHTAAGFVPSRSEYDAFDLSADRANAVRQILEREGLPPSHIFAVSGKADSQPLFPDDPVDGRQSPRDHHADARRPAAAAESQAVRRRQADAIGGVAAIGEFKFDGRSDAGADVGDDRLLAIHLRNSTTEFSDRKPVFVSVKFGA